ncbi:MlaE family ABC transporter permease [Tundrisphaera lichenicola]|uniref:MlaE family ABC transporter permease n=1 Tax=Tundrisphaera lichenicola TaxID=2029860 RepID=UPI003EC1347E
MVGSLVDGLVDFGRFVGYAVQVIRALPRAARDRPAEVLRQFERVAWGGLPVVAAAGTSIGLVTWLQVRRLLATYGAEETLPSVLSAAVLVETGPVLASLLVAGRMGAGLGAELGSMTMTEELDAREVLGASTIDSLVAPRAIACLVAVPLLTILIDVFAILGGFGAELIGGSLSAEAFRNRSLDFLRLSDVIPATLKTAVFGLLIALIGCWTGLNADRSTEAIGHAATRGVVLSMLAVFAANVVIVPLVQAIVEAVGWTG